MPVGKSPSGRWAIPQNLTPAGKICWCFNLPDDPEFQAVFWGLMNDLTKRYNWGEPLTADSDTVANYWRAIIDDNRTCFEDARDMANRGCGDQNVVERRINEDTGLSEVSYDGESFVPDPEDGRTSGILLPLPPGTPLPDARCSGAESAALAIKLIIDQAIARTADWDALISLIAGIVAAFASIFGPVGAAIAAIIGTICIFMFSLGRQAVIDAMTPAVYDTLACIFYCRISLDASFSSGQWQAVKDDIVSQLDGAAENIVWHFVQLLGPVYLTNAARMFPNAGADCSACACSCDSPTLGDEGENLLSRPDLGVGYWEVTTTLKDEPGCEPNGCYYATILIPACCLHNAYEIVPPGVNAPPGNRMAIDCNGVPGFANYGLGGCQSAIVFRSYGSDTFYFQIIDCP